MSTPRRLLHIDASPRGERSRSRAIAQSFLSAVAANKNAPDVEQMDLWQAKLPDLGDGMIEGRYDLIAGNKVAPELAAKWQAIQRIVDHFLSFDAYLISTPMWNFGLPYPLKHYIDVITQPGMTFTNDAEGNVEGHAAGKKAMIIAASALPIAPDGPLEHLDFQLRYLQSWLGFIGVTDMQSLRVAPTYGPDETVEAAMRDAEAKARAIAASF